jgi:uncharacterized membrane protein (UPF0127 family)
MKNGLLVSPYIDMISSQHSNIVMPNITYYFRTPRDIKTGLMGMTYLPSDSVALFDMDKPDDYQFYMKDTLIPLDVIFIEPNGIVVGVLENMSPLDTTPRGIGAKSRFVIEANAGYVKRHNIQSNETRFLIPGSSI